MLKTPNLQAIYDYVLNHIKGHPIEVYHQYKPQKINPPLIVYRVEYKQTRKPRRYYQVLQDKNIHKIADLDIIFHLFLIAKQDQILNLANSLNSHIANIQNTNIENMKVEFDYEIFSPFESPEFEKEQFFTMKATLKALTIIFDEKTKIPISVNSEQSFDI